MTSSLAQTLYMCRLVGLALFLLCAPGNGAVPVANPSFESGLENWSLWSGAGSNNDPLERDHTSLSGTQYGFWSLGVKGIGGGGKGAFQYVSGGWESGRRYRITVWVKNVAQTNLVYRIGYVLGSGTAAQGTTATYGATVSRPAVWTQASVDLDYAGTSGVTIYLCAVNDGHSERAGFDLVEVLDLGAGGPTPTATRTTAPGTPTATPTAGAFRYPGFAYSQLLDHFRYYHERSECIYEGNGAWAALETNLRHPLVRDSSRRAQGYIKAFAILGDAVYDARARAALDWLLSDQNADGHFTWWNTPEGTNNEFDCLYSTGTGASALAEGYAFYRDARYLAGSARAAQWEAPRALVWNTNYNLFAVWHLAKHYGLTGERQWLDAAVDKVARGAFPLQDADGGWREGPGAPVDMIGHNKRIWYHGIILRGLCELYRVLPADHAIRAQLRQSIERGVARAYAMQKPTGEIAVGAGVPNEHRNAFILEALLMAYQYVGLDTRDAVRGIMQYRMDFSQPPYQDKAFNIDIQALGRLLELYPAIVPHPPPAPTPTPGPTSPTIVNPDFELDGGFFTLPGGWQTYSYGKREGFQEAGRGWVVGVADYPEGKSAGIYQFVCGVQPGGRYRLSVSARTTSSQLAARIGVAPIATHDCHRAVFSASHGGSSWATLQVDVVAQDACLTLFLEGRNTDPFRISFERVLFDAARIDLLSPPVATVTPTPPRGGIHLDLR